MEIKDYYTRINFGDRSECVNIINCSIDDNFDEHGVYREKIGMILFIVLISLLW